MKKRFLVLFDIDGTLVEAAPELNAKSSQLMFDEVFGLQNASESDIKPSGKIDRQIMTEVLMLHAPDKLPFSSAVAEQAYKSRANHFAKLAIQKPIQELAGIRPLLTALTQWQKTAPVEVILGLLTGNSPYLAQTKLELTNLASFFTSDENGLPGVFGSMANQRGELIPVVQKRYNVPEENIAVIDDSLIGAQMINNGSFFGIMVATGLYPIEELSPLVDHAFPNFDDGRWQDVANLIQDYAHQVRTSNHD